MSEKELLGKYLPAQSVETAFKWIKKYNVHLKITKSRTTKSGDYRPPIRYTNHRISVNHNLNKYAFLITFVHEMAHLMVWEKYNNKVLPHGKEWKDEYRNLMIFMMNTGSFPNDIHVVLQKSIINSKASSNGDLALTRVLRGYDINSNLHLEDIDENELFALENGKIFRKGTKRRTRYICLNMIDNKNYAVHPLAPIKRIEEKNGYYSFIDDKSN